MHTSSAPLHISSLAVPYARRSSEVTMLRAASRVPARPFSCAREAVGISPFCTACYSESGRPRFGISYAQQHERLSYESAFSNETTPHTKKQTRNRALARAQLPVCLHAARGGGYAVDTGVATRRELQQEQQGFGPRGGHGVPSLATRHDASAPPAGLREPKRPSLPPPRGAPRSASVAQSFNAAARVQCILAAPTSAATGWSSPLCERISTHTKN